MISTVLVILVGIWIWWSFRGETKRDDIRSSKEYASKIAHRQMIVERMPDSARAHESLGDVLREAGKPNEAIAFFERAIQLAQDDPMSLSGTGLENKLKLAKEEAARGGLPAYGETMATRQQLCRRCGTLNMPTERNCISCANPMPVDSVFDTFRHDGMRRSIVREGTEFAAMLVVITFAIAIFDGMPLEIKGLLMISTTAVLGWLLLKKVGGNGRFF